MIEAQLQAQGPEFAGDNVSFTPELSTVRVAAEAQKAFWVARQGGDVAAMQTAREQMTAAGGVPLAAIQLAQKL